MLKTLKLENFRKVVDDEMSFTPGINVLRGSNEASKTTRLEAVSYALFGTRALRTPLEQAVTWGQDVKTLRVELTIDAGGQTCTFRRSKAGAEVIKDGKVFCTGQNEVSLLASSLLGADVNTAQSLLMAPQGAIRGALEQGPKALSLLIENLSSMEVFDQILDAAQTKLTLGSPAVTQSQLDGARATLESAKAEMPPKPDAEAHAKAIADLDAKMTEIEAGYPALDAAAVEAEKQWQEASARYMDKVGLKAKLDAAQATQDAAQAQVETLAPAAHRTFEMSTIDVLQERLAWAEDHGKRLTAYQTFSRLPECPRQEGGSAEELADLIEERTRTLNSTVEELNMVRVQVDQARSRRIDHDKCDKCGQDVTHLDHVVRTNAEVDTMLVELSPKIATLGQQVQTLRGTVAALDMIRRGADRLNAELRKLHGYVTLNDDFYPPKVIWIGEPPANDAPDVQFMRQQLQEARANVKAIETAKAQYALARQQWEAAYTARRAAADAYSVCPAPEPEEILRLTSVKDDCITAANAARGRVRVLDYEGKELYYTHDTAMNLWRVSNARVKDAQRVIDQCEKDLVELTFNNALVKKLRAIRPLIANKLWNTVLASVSVMFSQMRGEESWVTKEKDGFYVNGQAVESLSGSTLDILGLAIRVTLTKVFIPQCSILMLDEAAASMDASRTELMLGFIAGAGIDQILFVTHEAISETVAHNVIEL